MSRAGRRYPRTSAERGELFEELIVRLLVGWGADVPSDPGDPFAVFIYTEREFGELWARHEARLRAEAARRKLRPTYRGPDGARRFFGEMRRWEYQHSRHAEHVQEED